MKKIKKWTRILLALNYRNKHLQTLEPPNSKHYLHAYELLFQKSAANSFEKYIHRTILWDSEEPLSTLPSIKSVFTHSKEYQHILWNGKTVNTLISSFYDHPSIYFNYPKKIMKADFARYFILYEFGGVYLDLDITMHTSIDLLVQKANKGSNTDLTKKEFCILFEEHRWENKKNAVDHLDQPIRKFLEPNYYTEALSRVANYAIIATPQHPFIKKIIEECKKRSTLIPQNDYDILFITGPDIVSHVYHISETDFLDKHNVILIPKEEHNHYITHFCDSHWREDIKS